MNKKNNHINRRDFLKIVGAGTSDHRTLRLREQKRQSEQE